MLQHNNTGRAHLTHVAVVGLHGLCCGLPVLGMLAATVSGVASISSVAADLFGYFHEFIHRHEMWIVMLSAALVGAGGWLEAQARLRGHAHGFPWAFAVSTGCFLVNVAIIASHRV